MNEAAGLPAFYKIFLPVLAAALALSSCAGPGQEAQPALTAAPAALPLSSPAFEPGQPIPSRYTCQGEDISPPLEWQAPPPGTQSFALIMDDPDAPGAVWVHWVVYNLPPGARGLPEAAAGSQTSTGLPEGAVTGTNSWRRAGYGGPCPPSGEHRYFFRLYALDTTLDQQPLDKQALLKAIDGHILGQGELVGTYRK